MLLTKALAAILLYKHGSVDEMKAHHKSTPCILSCARSAVAFLLTGCGACAAAVDCVAAAGVGDGDGVGEGEGVGVAAGVGEGVLEGCKAYCLSDAKALTKTVNEDAGAGSLQQVG